MAITLPAGTTLTPLDEIAREHDRSLTLARRLVSIGRIEAILLGRKYYVTETEALRLRREGWPAERNVKARAYWAEFRQWRRQQEAAA